MITLYKTKYQPATDTTGAHIVVTCVTTATKRTVAIDFGANNANRAAVSSIHGFDPDTLAYVGSEGKFDFYAHTSL